MALVAAFQMLGLKLWFWSNDHTPPHFHAKKRGEWEVKVHVLHEPNRMIEIVWSRKAPPARTLRQLASLAEMHRIDLLEQWERIRGIES